MAFLLGWKDILRPIRDGYRHLFPSPDTGPTPEERQRQRAIDRLRGFTYFDTFEQLQSWTAADTDILQRANTPLLVRSGNYSEEPAKANVLLCHDYAGNYHAYEATSNIGLAEEIYACEYLQYVGTFIYFSHKLVCIPPPTWTNSLHRNGVKALGTILIEPQTSGSEELLQRGDDGLSFPLATKLANIAEQYGFDGWLVNIEKPFSSSTWNHHVLAAFLRQLMLDLGAEKQLIWYDALTTANKVNYQNALNAQNMLFAKACGAILTNYCWKEGNAVESMHNALQNGIQPQHVYLGVDVWAQNVTKLTQPRITYPEYGGGGTNTGVAVAKVAEVGLSAGIFAPAWTFEHFVGHGREAEYTMWDGADLPIDATCSCGDPSTRHQPNKMMPITTSAKNYSAGSDNFFFTDFSRAYSRHSDEEAENLFDGYKLHAQLGSQSILPLKMDPLDALNPLKHDIEVIGGRSQLIIEYTGLPQLTDKLRPTDGWRIPLFTYNMPADGSLRLRMVYRALSKTTQGTSFYIKISDTIYSLEQLDYHENDYHLDILIDVKNTAVPGGPRLEELGFFSEDVDPGAGMRLAEVDFICIQPVVSYPGLPRPLHCRGNTSQATSVQQSPSTISSGNCTIFNIHKVSQDEGETNHTRLCWNHRHDGQPLKGMPYSTITGPFSYFEVRVDGLVLGRTFAPEHILPAPFVERLAGRTILVQIKGIGFDGQELASDNTTLCFLLEVDECHQD